MGNAARKVVHVQLRPASELLEDGDLPANDPWVSFGPILCKLYRRWKAKQPPAEVSCKPSE